MPRRKKLGQSPARPTGPEERTLGGDTNCHQAQSLDSAMATNSFPKLSVHEQIVRNMQEMFANVDPEVIYIVLSECDFKVENAMDSLLELSVTVEPPPTVTSTVSGFEHTAAVLLNSQHSSQSLRHPPGPAEPCSSPHPDVVTDELDLLVDKELELLTAQQDLMSETSVDECPCVDTHTNFLVHTPEKSKQDTSEMDWSSQVTQPSGSASKRQLENLLTKIPVEKVQDSLDLASGCSSVFQVAIDQDSAPDNTASVQPEVSLGRAGPQLKLTSAWNPDSPVFTPKYTSHQQPSFITPVASPYGPPSWGTWAPVNSVDPCPKLWALPTPPDVAGLKRLRLEGKVLVLLRGAPGSGKSTLAGALKEHNPGAVILSTDDFFLHNGQYRFNPNVLGEAHEWNHEKAKEAFRRGDNPIVIDNTNMQGWEMKPYVAQALIHKYKVLFREPDTWWRNKPRELERRSRHRVPVEKIRRMLDNYERFVSVHSIMGSALPESRQRLPLDNRNPQPVLSDTVCAEPPGHSGHTEGSTNSQPHLSSSPPDVSSIVRSTDDAKAEDTENLDLLAEPVDSERNVSLLASNLEANLRIPDCIVESVTIEDHGQNEIPFAFSGSIKQREPRERPSRKSEFEKKDQGHLIKDDNNQSEMDEGQLKKVGNDEERETSKALDFEGDWPTEGTLQQRAARKRGGQKEDVKKGQNKLTGTLNVKAGPDSTEFQKVINLILTSEEDQTSSPASRSPAAAEDCSEDDPDEVRVELADCACDVDAEKATAKHVLQDISNNPDPSALKLVSPNVPLVDHSADAEVTTELRKEAKNEDEDNGRACQIVVNKNTKEDINSPKVFENDCSVEGSMCDSSQETSLDDQGPNLRHGSRKQLKTLDCPDISLESLNNPDTKDLDCQDNPTHPTTINAGFACNNVPDKDTEEQSSQTEPQDFALVWRLHHQDGSDKMDDPGASFSAGFQFIEGSSSRFVPQSTSQVYSANIEVPYHVAHEKGTQVEENDFGSFTDRLESLRILSGHFKLVTFDTLEDLYDKCHQDLEWTTNLLLDSGEKFFKEEEHVDNEDVFGVTSYHKSTRFKSDDTIVRCDTLLENRTSSGYARDEDTIEPPTTETLAIYESKVVDCSGVEKPQICDKLDAESNSDTKVSQGEHGQTEESESMDVLQSPREGFNEEAWSGMLSCETDIRSINEIHRLLQEELEEIEKADKQNSREKLSERRSAHVEIRSVEMKLPTEVALQLTELFGPVGVDPASDTCSTDEYTVQLDLHLAKLLHQKWKETIQERQTQAALSFHLLQENFSHDKGPNTDHWYPPRKPVSLRDIIKEEQALQRNMEKSRKDRSDIDKRDSATLLKENQLLAKFPAIDRHFLQDIFRDHNYSLVQTEMFLHSLLDHGPAKTVIAPAMPRSDHQRTASKERDKTPPESKPTEDYQDTEEPQYEDFRAEAILQRRRQLENFSKAAEAFKQGRKDVASFYAQQAHLHGQSMSEANHRAAIQIFERVNSTLLPQNILDLHGLHVEEALQHLQRVLQDKIKEHEQGLCRPQLSVITGRGNRSQGGVARIRPAVIDYLNNRRYRFSEPNPGLVLVYLK